MEPMNLSEPNTCPQIPGFSRIPRIKVFILFLTLWSAEVAAADLPVFIIPPAKADPQWVKIVAARGYAIRSKAEASGAVFQSHPGFDDLPQWKQNQKAGGRGFADSFGVGSLAFARARSRGEGVGSVTTGGFGLSPQAMINLHLYRAISERPDWYGFEPKGESEWRFFRDFPVADLKRLFDRFDEGPLSRPLAEIAFFSPRLDLQEERRQMEEILPPVVEGLIASGFDVRVSATRDPLGEAALYYFVTPGNVTLLPTAWLKKLSDDRQEAFVQVWAGIPLVEHWREIRKRLGWNADREIRAIDDLPGAVVFGKQRLRWRGFGLASSQGLDLKPMDLRGADAAIEVRETGAVWMTTYRQKTFLNGNLLHPEVAYVIEKRAGRLGKRSFPQAVMCFYGTNSAFFALQDVELDVELPGLGERVKIFRRDPVTGYEPESVESYSGHLRVTLKRFEVLIANRF